MLLCSHMSSRNQLGQMLNNLDLRGEAVEIGTHRGEFAAILLSSWEGRKLTCVDPWWTDKNSPEWYADQARLLWGTTDHELSARTVLEEFGDRCKLMKDLSSDVTPSFKDESLDLVYIDGDHREQAVLQDLRMWWPKLRPGGVMAGHDFVMPGEPHGGWGRGIQAALQAFIISGHVQDPDHDVSLIVEEGGLPWSFYMFKDER